MIKNTLLLGSTFFAIAAVTSQPAFAQVAAANEPCVDANDNSICDADEEDDVIYVTGSRIRLPNFETNEPTVTVDEQYIEERGLTNVADALNELPGFRGSVTPNGAQGSFGQGVNFVNNFGLGSNRTLTLVNGRRFVSSNVPTLFNQGSAGTQVDLNVIPTILVDRIDTVSVGGAPVYGSDAISGTVNIILRTDYEGIEVRGNAGVTDRGDGFRYNTSVAAGFNFADDRGNVSFSYSRDRVDGLLSRARSFVLDDVGGVTNLTTAQAIALRGAGANTNDGRLNPNIGFNNSTTDGNPGTILVRELRIPFLTNGGLITAATGAGSANVIQRLQFAPNGDLIPFDRGITFLSPNSSGGDGFQFSDYAQITSDLQRDIFNAFARFEISPAAEVFFEGTYFRSRGDELVQQPAFNSSLFGGLSAPLTFDTTSPFLTAQARSLLQANGITSFQVSKAQFDLADLTGFSENRLYRGVFGVRGDFSAAGRDFNYEISANYGQTDITDVRQDLNAQRFINAVNVTTDANGNIVCTATPTRQAAPGGVAVADASCVPLNPLGFGRPSQAARDYVISTNVTESVLKQTVFNANLGGSFFDLPGGPFSFNLGYEHREEEGGFSPSEFERLGRGRAVAIAPVSGGYNVDEVFGELFAPIVNPENNLSYLHRLEVFARGRYVDNTVNGGFFAWSAGGNIAIIRDIEFRGNYTKSFRAPAITELFLPVSNSFSAVADLCSPGNRNAGPVPAIRNANCTAFLNRFPTATPLLAASATVPSRSGGNPTLENEVASTFTYGVILRPRFLPGLRVSVDYVDITIDNPIANLTVAQIVSGCFDNPVFNTADPANGNAFCSQIRRDATGQVISDAANPGVISGFVNGNQIKFSGIQASLDWRRDVSDAGLNGDIEITGDLLYNRRRLVDITGVAPARSDGIVGDPEFGAQLNVRYLSNADWGFTASFNYVGEQLISRFNRAPQPNDTREFDQYNDYVTMNASAYIDVGEDFRLTFAVTNVFDRIGQRYYGSFIPGATNDLFGRRYNVGVRINY